ncbi:MAG: formate dehydrogenase accessory sulfurtransferase FdhD [Saprospiraceae bacterium]
MKGIKHKNALKIGLHSSAAITDILAIEEPLEIQLWDYKEEGFFPLSINMRTPGEDQDLCRGFLFAEGIIGQKGDIQEIEQTNENVIRIRLVPQIRINQGKIERYFFSSSSCGVCGKKSLNNLSFHSCYFPAKGHPLIDVSTLLSLPQQLKSAQSLFQQTGGIHAAGLFSPQGELLLIREDVGRHNALDKLIGAALEQAVFPWRDHLLLLSGRISFELIQKASMTGVPIIAAVGAPSSLAVELAEECGITLIGFIRDKRCNVYTGEERLRR